MDEEPININADDEPSYSYFDEIYNVFDFITGLIQNNGWYFLALVIVVAYLFNKYWPSYLKWSKRRAEEAYEAKMKKNPDLFKQKQEELKKSRLKFLEEYEKNAKISYEKQKEKEQKLLEEKRASLNNLNGGQTINRSQKYKHKPDYNPLMGHGGSSNYRPPRRSPCSGGGCG